MTDCIKLSSTSRNSSHSLNSHLLDSEEQNGTGSYSSIENNDVRQRQVPKSFWERWRVRLCPCLYRETPRHPRVVQVGRPSKTTKYPANVIRNQKYSVLTFPFLVLLEQFKLFLNFCFLVMAVSQFVPQLRIGSLYTYWGPLCFVLLVTMVREAVDDIRRWRRDRELNSTLYARVGRAGVAMVPSSELRVGDVLRLGKNGRVPADMVLLRSCEANGACFLRTDQLDGETDWKLRHAASAITQNVETDEELLDLDASVHAECPSLDIHNFVGNLSLGNRAEASLSVENTMWANTVVASGWAVGVVVYTGNETRAVMNNSPPRCKLGLVDREIDNIAKLLVACVLLLALLLVCLKGFGGQWYKYYWRFFLLFSYIIPLALRINLDLAKITYSFLITRDAKLEGNIVRNTTIPEELGRIKYLLTDKTGTLTENEMVFKKLHLGSVAFTDDEESRAELMTFVAANAGGDTSATNSTVESNVTRRGADVGARAAAAVLAVAVCHNVTPARDSTDSEHVNEVSYQASSPDEVALVRWAAGVGVSLEARDSSSLTLRLPDGSEDEYDILHLFPFTSESKRMGVVLRRRRSNRIVYFVKGADSVVGPIVNVDWLNEEVDNMAREGLRTLVVASRTVPESEYSDWLRHYEKAQLQLQDRAAHVSAAVALLDPGLGLVCVTGVEDKLQDGVRQTLETLRNAGVRVWMLTGDKLETACCIAKSSRLTPNTAGVYVFSPTGFGPAELDKELRTMSRRAEAGDTVVISGENLEAALLQDEKIFVQHARTAQAVVVCRCSPTQKARVVNLVQSSTGSRCAAVGDGGNDVSMIQAADCGLGLVGKEGKQASLAADFSITRFKHVSRLLLVHGRRCYKNSAVLAQFIVHRGLAISTMQAIFSAIFFYVAIPLFPGLLMVGYATIFTMFPVFSLVLDKDIEDATAEKYPELYRELVKGRELSVKTFCIWLGISVYQGGVLMYGSLLLFEGSFLKIVSIGFTSLVLTELIMVSLTVHTWHWAMFVAEALSLCFYAAAVFMLPMFFDLSFVLTLSFLIRVVGITAVSAIPVLALKIVRGLMDPSLAKKLQH